jgi:hypothetical protein
MTQTSWPSATSWPRLNEDLPHVALQRGDELVDATAAPAVVRSARRGFGPAAAATLPFAAP